MRKEKLFTALIATAGFLLIHGVDAASEPGTTANSPRHVDLNGILTKMLVRTKRDEVLQARRRGAETTHSKMDEDFNDFSFDYRQLNAYLNVVREEVEDEILKQLIKKFQIGSFDDFLKKYTNDMRAYLNEDRKRVAEIYLKSLRESVEGDEKQKKLLEDLIECGNRATDNGIADWFEEDWRSYWAVVFLYAADFKGLEEDVKKRLKKAYDGCEYE